MSKSMKQNHSAFDPSAGRRNRKVPLISVARMVGRRIQTKSSTINDDPPGTLKFAWVSPSRLAFNYGRQRWPETTQISKLCQKWDLVCVTPLQARYSASEDLYYIADGQQHAIAWILKYGEECLLPVFYVESEDENVETRQLLALNNDSLPMAKYFIHQQKCMMGDLDSLALEKCVRDAGCETGYKKYSAGSVTHITDLLSAQKDYGLDNLGHVLVKIRHYWPSEKIQTATMMGFLKLKELMEQAGVYDDDTFEDVFSAAEAHFESSDRLHLDIKEEFSNTYPTNHMGMGVREKIASGLISVYEQTTGNKLCDMPFPIKMPMMSVIEEGKAEYALS